MFVSYQVDPSMSAEVGKLGVRFVADVTAERLRAAVDVRVLLESAEAEWTLENRIGSYNSQIV